GQPAAELLPAWKREVTVEPVLPGRERLTVTWTDPRTALEVRCELTRFLDHPAVEWLLRLRNTGRVATPILQDVRSLDVAIHAPDRERIVLHHAKGSTHEAP